MPAEKRLNPALPPLALRFATGAGMGVLILVVPFSAGSPFQLGTPSILAAGAVVVAAGVLSCLWGARFLDAISKALDSTPV